jgi:hypothetical protein
MAEGDTEYIDPEAYNKYGGGGSAKDFFNYRIILMMHCNKILGLGSVEFHGGYNKQSQVALDNNRILITETHVPDTRQSFGNSIIMLYCWALPRIMNQVKDDEVQRRLFSAKGRADKATEAMRAEEKDEAILKEYVTAHVLLFQELNICLDYFDYGTKPGVIE